MAERDFIRVFIGSDPHCGHAAGLTPPEYWYEAETRMFSHRVIQQQRDLWLYYTSHLEPYKPIDVAIWSGDMIDGKGTRSGGTELLTTDRNKQCGMALIVARQPEADMVYMVYGTPYHTGDAEDWEKLIAAPLKAILSGQLFVKIGDMIFDIKHHLGSSSVPYGDMTAPLKDMTWNQVIYATNGEQPRADVIIRSHNHKFRYTKKDKTHVIVTPGLQGWGSKYGVRKISRSIDFGFLIMDIYPGKLIQLYDETMEGVLQKVEVHQSQFSSF